MTKPTMNQVLEAVESDDHLGFCLACGEESHGVEPDARRYKCESCGEHKVFGAEEILVMGALDDSEESPVFNRTTQRTKTSVIDKPTAKKARIPSIQQLLTGKEQSPGIKQYARETLMQSGILIHAGVMLIRIHEPIEAIVSDGAKIRVNTINRVWGEPHDDSEELGPGDFVTINEKQCRRMIGKRTKTRFATVNELYRRAAEKHGNVYRWFRSVAIGDAETKTPNSIIGFNTAGERVAVIACVIDEE